MNISNSSIAPLAVATYHKMVEHPKMVGVVVLSGLLAGLGAMCSVALAIAAFATCLKMVEQPKTVAPCAIALGVAVVGLGVANCLALATAAIAITLITSTNREPTDEQSLSRRSFA